MTQCEKIIDQNMSLEDTLTLLGQLAENSLHLWDLPPDAHVKLINVSENATYLVQSGDFKAILRIHREGYHTKAAIQSEIAWTQALNAETEVATPDIYIGRNGEKIQSGIVPELNTARFMVLFHFVEGEQPDETKDLTGDFEKLGEIAARAHLHTIDWQRPKYFERMVWDDEAVFGKNATWGDWRKAPLVTDEVRGILEDVEALIKKRLAIFGKHENNYGLIHADMRLANLILHKDGPRLIDFDDCGFGWFLYDFAAAISFIEDDPKIPSLKEAWVRGYRKIRPLSQDEELEIATFVMLRRMALLAWIGSRIEAPEPQAMAPIFAKATAELGAKYLEEMRISHLSKF